MLYNTTGFKLKGEVILHNGTAQGPPIAAKRLFETFFKSVEFLSAKDVTEYVVLLSQLCMSVKYSQLLHTVRWSCQWILSEGGAVSPGISMTYATSQLYTTDVSLCRPLLTHLPTQHLMFLQKCRAHQLHDSSAPHGVKIRFEFGQNQRLQMVATGKPVRMNDFLSKFEDSFGQPSIVDRAVPMRARSLSPMLLEALPDPPKLLGFAKQNLQVLSMLADVLPTHKHVWFVKLEGLETCNLNSLSCNARNVSLAVLFASCVYLPAFVLA